MQSQRTKFLGGGVKTLKKLREYNVGVLHKLCLLTSKTGAQHHEAPNSKHPKPIHLNLNHLSHNKHFNSALLNSHRHLIDILHVNIGQ